MDTTRPHCLLRADRLQVPVDRLSTYPERRGDGFDGVLTAVVHLATDLDFVRGHDWGATTYSATCTSSSKSSLSSAYS